MGFDLLIGFGFDSVLFDDLVSVFGIACGLEVVCFVCTLWFGGLVVAGWLGWGMICWLLG